MKIMRTSLAVAPAFVIAALSRGSAQCPASIQKLATDQKYDEARAAAQALIKTNASDDAALHCMGRLYLAERKSGDAVDWFEKAVKANDNNALHHFYLGNALGDEAQKANKLRQPMLARRVKAEFERAVALDPNLVEAHEGLMQYYLQAPGFMGGSQEKAKEQAATILRLNPLRGHFALANIADRNKDLVTVEAELKAAITAAPDSVTAWFSLGAFYQNQKKWTEAFALYDRMIKEQPGETLAHFQYGRVAALSGENMERGERELRYWLSSAPSAAPIVTQSGAHMRIAMIYERQGKKDAARTEYQTALSLNPKNSDAKKMLDALK
jgi:tetratricopeptide (TPR) repeat protein